ncbi:aldehyde dehydrogenase [Ammoniphilus resinae]|uniref:Aldehyde dehydrogenase n=1 Tax=Ammoniphilus resinae TaxID=861532 RepID=A0ABS4GKS6_9BACL|nr:aldehyde dehydrogenase (NAD+) [Ammoniphilus resinae]
MQNFNEIIAKQRRFFLQGKTKEVFFRIKALHSLDQMIRSHEKELTAALKKDLNKSEFESYMTEIGSLLEEIRFMRKHIKKWAKPRKVKSTIFLIGSKSYIYPEPYGVALIISPWNYPFQLSIAPLIGAIAAGNCAVLKPSEFTPETSQLLAELIAKTFPEEYITVVQGEGETSQALLEEKWDYLFFTGSVSVGKKIMEAAAKHLTPVTLELGGKSPCIIHHDANLKLAAKRIAWGKFLNAGQTCVAPDYLYVHHTVMDKFLHLLTEAIKELYTDHVLESGTFTKIVSERHFQRLVKFLADGIVAYGGKHDRQSLIVEPTILNNVTWEDSVMQEEIFGPILPVLTYDHDHLVIEEINKHPKPLALYIFSENQAFQDTIIQQVSFGGGCINDTIFHLSSPYLPFGGVGESGMGAYHGKGSFDVFSHVKSILKQTTAFDLPFRYPHKKNALQHIKRFLK